MIKDKTILIYKEMNNSEISKVFKEALEKNNLETIKLLDDYSDVSNKMSIENYNTVLLYLCENNRIEILDYILKSKSFDHHFSNQKSTSTKKDLTNEACISGHLDILQYLLKSEKLKQYYSLEHLQEGFALACKKSHLNIIQYLLTAEDLKQHIDINYQSSLGFISACEYGHLGVVKYLLTSTELKKHANMHARNDEGIRKAIYNNHIEIIKFLIFDMNIELTKTIEVYIEDKYKPEVMKLFDIRNLNNKLEHKLNTTSKDNKEIPAKTKI